MKLKNRTHQAWPQKQKLSTDMHKQSHQREVAQVPITWLIGSFACGPLFLWVLKRLQAAPKGVGELPIAEYITPMSAGLIFDFLPGVLAGLVMACLLAVAVNIRFAFQTRTQRFAIFAACEVAFILGCLLGLWLLWESVPG